MQNTSPAIPRLGIKEYDWWNEALHGVGRAGLATVFPQAIGMGASFNDSLLYEVFDAVSDEARVKSRIFSENGVLKRYQGLTFWTPNATVLMRRILLPGIYGRLTCRLSKTWCRKRM